MSVGVLYADQDTERQRHVAQVLMTAGFAVMCVPVKKPFLAEASFRGPDVVLLSNEMKPLGEVAHALWPKAKVLSFADDEDYRNLPERIRLALMDTDC